MKRKKETLLVILHMFQVKLDLYLLMLQVKLSKSTINDSSLILKFHLSHVTLLNEMTFCFVACDASESCV